MRWPQHFSLRNLANMTNSIVGISILTMPYCFDQCGIVLATVALLISGLMTSYSCKLLFKTSETKNSRNLEFLAFKLFGHLGKLLIEICIILLLFGSLVTYQQTINDAAPKFVAKLIRINPAKISHPIFMLFFTILVALPLSLSSKLEKLSNISMFAVLFYLYFGIYLMWTSITKYDLKDFLEVRLWDPSGLFKCFPIFCVSYSCQTVVFVVCDELKEHSKENLINLMDISMVIAFLAYASVGVFGAVAFHDVKISGNVITMFPDSFMSQIILFGLIICVLSGFPYMVFPCRNSINTLFFSNKEDDETTESEYYIPETRFKYITYGLVATIAGTAMLVPNMEFVLSLTGATTGSLICYIWPSVLYLAAHSKSEKQDNKVKVFLMIGLLMFFFCTAATLMEFNPTKSNDNFFLTDEISTINNKLAFKREIFINTEKKIENFQARKEPINPVDSDNNNKDSITESNALYKIFRPKRNDNYNNTK